jgi:prophage regulatory protein
MTRMAHWNDFLDPNGPDGAYLPWKKVEPRVGISRTTAWRLQKAGEFPKPYVVSPGRVAYRESEVEAWKASRAHRTARPASHPQPVARSEDTASPSSADPIAPPEMGSPLVRPPQAPNPPDTPVKSKSRRRSRRPSSDGQITFEF